MNPREILEIQEAENLLIKAEKTFPSEASAGDFRNAFEILNDYIEYEKPNENVETFILNLKLSYTRTVVTHLDDIPTKEFHIFVYYLVLLIITMKNEFDELLNLDKDLKVKYKSCKQKFAPQLKEALEEALNELRKNA